MWHAIAQVSMYVYAQVCHQTGEGECLFTGSSLSRCKCACVRAGVGAGVVRYAIVLLACAQVCHPTGMCTWETRSPGVDGHCAHVCVCVRVHGPEHE